LSISKIATVGSGLANDFTPQVLQRFWNFEMQVNEFDSKFSKIPAWVLLVETT
jgi:hypothetical protein